MQIWRRGRECGTSHEVQRSGGWQRENDIGGGKRPGVMCGGLGLLTRL